ncbi:DUF2852 domain-containing protein [Methylobacterium sp. BTF04]|uniref:DUF2852 domain-containing protein n=1 Tax=Methylobacterium sp. BTF04 TaxID=2708300 RepID=UPI0013D45B22|nr:DUF2852 domain-containing protein [Methylobacterium sp. BTF04]
MSFSSTSPWATGKACRSGPFPRRSFEIGAIVVGFIYWWPLAAAYVAWKVAGYPALGELRGWKNRAEAWQAGAGRSRFAAAFDAANGGGNTGNRAFDEYRRSELDRLDAQRKALQEESRAFAEFVEELKRAKDREQFDAFMAKRRSADARRNV